MPKSNRWSGLGDQTSVFKTASGECSLIHKCHYHDAMNAELFTVVALCPWKYFQRGFLKTLGGWFVLESVCVCVCVCVCENSLRCSVNILDVCNRKSISLIQSWVRACFMLLDTEKRWESVLGLSPLATLWFLSSTLLHPFLPHFPDRKSVV